MKSVFLKKVLCFVFLSLFCWGGLAGTARADITEALQGGFFKKALGDEGAEIVPAQGATKEDIAEKIGLLIKHVLEFLGVVILVVIIVAGIMWLTAGGNVEKAQKARKILFDAFMGGLVIGLAYAITAFILAATQTKAAST